MGRGLNYSLSQVNFNKLFKFIRYSGLDIKFSYFFTELFTALMYDLGVRGAQATEVFVLDDTLDFDDLG